MANNIKNLRKLYDYTQLSNDEMMIEENSKKYEIVEGKQDKLKRIFSVKLGFLANFKIVLDTREDNQRNLFILMLFIIWIEYLLNGLLVSYLIIKGYFFREIRD